TAGIRLTLIPRIPGLPGTENAASHNRGRGNVSAFTGISCICGYSFALKQKQFVLKRGGPDSSLQ
ncbi:MAG: hypothetical protein K5981_09825, partial [Clostridia bacterium]|nr:hypothetical protein [Clostridia bacterium]